MEGMLAVVVVGASTAAVATAQAKLVEAVAQRDNARDQSARLLELIKRGVYPEARRQEAISAHDSAEAVVAQAESALEEARQALGPAGAANPPIRGAIAAMAQANQTGRATCRDGVSHYVLISWVAGSLKNN